MERVMFYAVAMVTGEAAPLSVCSDQCKLLDTIHFCSASVFTHLVQMMYTESSSFFLLPSDCTAVADDPFSTGTDCMPAPRGLALQSESAGGELNKEWFTSPLPMHIFKD